MGNNSTKEARGPSRSRPASLRNASVSDPAPPERQSSAGFVQTLYGPSGRAARTGSRSDLAFSFGLGDRDATTPEQRRETKQEREARKLEKERVEREKEREKSLKEEHVDGGYLVTLGTYTGPEDFNKAVVRQLQIERRLAPFWKGLNDHNDSWVEHQLVAAARGLPIPAADEIPPELERPTIDVADGPGGSPSEAEVHRQTVPIKGRSTSNQSDLSANLSASHPAFSSTSPTSPSGMASGMALLRGRARTLASLTSTSRSGSTSQLTPQEIQLPKDPYVNGQPIEAYLYKDAQECPICFLYYPPYLNKTRCCDQPICSECFVQIKRPDPHPPEHHEDPSNPAPEQPKPDEDGLLVSEPSACPFCVTPEFGVTYEPPQFRRGLTYAGVGSPHPLASATSAMSSSTSLGSMVSRRRTTSLSATDKSVITTDKVRPDWAKKLADARAHALRRSAAATALHNAAYVLGNTQSIDLRAFNLGRRRRLFGEGSSGGQSTPDTMGLGNIFGRGDGQQNGEDGSGNTGQRGGPGRRSRVDDLEELMMMEAIRLSLLAEEERKKKEDKDAAKEAKKKAKQDAKDAKKAEKAAKKAEKAGSLYTASTNQSTSTWASTPMSRSTSNLGPQLGSAGIAAQGKGKAPALGTLGFNPLSEPTSTVNREASKVDEGPRSTDVAQRYLEESRAHLPQPSQPISLPNSSSNSQRGHHRQFSGASSIGSSIMETNSTSYRSGLVTGTPPGSSNMAEASNMDHSGTATPQQEQASSGEPMLNFNSLAAIIGKEKGGHQAEHTEVASDVETPIAEPTRNEEALKVAHITHGVERASDHEADAPQSGDSQKAAEVVPAERDLVNDSTTTQA
ncbi:hypothetical protein ANO11243_021610 [Dothideomycetidae sp. 11243]|nr:hypothetical protein ANO11243_021610 [fungal sp. No.11243]